MLLLVSVLGGPGLEAAVFSDNFNQGDRVFGIGTFRGSNDNATAELGEPGHFAEPARHSVWLRWTPTVTATYSLSTSGTALDTVLAVYLGTALGNLKAVVTNDDIDFRTFGSRVTFRAYAGETFHIAVDGAGGAVGRFELAILQGGPRMESWTTTTATGAPVDSEDLRAPVLLFDFWETTCGACVEEIYELFALQRLLGPKGFSLVGMALDLEPKTVNNFLLEYPAVYPQALSSLGAVASFNRGLPIGPPTKYLVDQDRRIVGTFQGGLTPISSTLPYYAGVVLPLLRSSSIPKLELERRAGQVRVSWPEGAVPSGLRLESNASPSPEGWNPVATTPESEGDRRVVTLPLEQASRFYRLRQP